MQLLVIAQVNQFMRPENTYCIVSIHTSRPAYAKDVFPNSFAAQSLYHMFVSSAFNHASHMHSYDTYFRMPI